MTKLGELKIKKTDRNLYPDEIGREAGISPKTEIQMVNSISRMTGTGYKNIIYRVVKTNDAVIVHKNYYSSDGFYDVVDYVPEYFTEQKNYGRECGRLSKKYHIPYDLCLALGTEEKVKLLLSCKKEKAILDPNGLYCGIKRRKSALREILGNENYITLGIDMMGQTNSERIARYIAVQVNE